MNSRLDPRGVDSALRLFVAFVVDDKQKQIHQRLLTAERRAETLATLPRWLSGRQAPLAGADQSPEGLRKRFGELVGVRIAAEGATRVTIAQALQQGRGVASVFVADNGFVALVTRAGEPPILCSRL